MLLSRTIRRRPNVRSLFLLIAFLENLFTFRFSVLSCNGANATAEATGCPKGSNCIENGTVNGTLQSVCVCGSNFTVNRDYSSTDNKSLYCIEKDNETHPTNAPPTQTPKLTTTVLPLTTTAKATEKPSPKNEPTEHPIPTSTAPPTTKKTESDKNDVKVAPAPQTHHILGGILLPMFIVLAFIAGVFAIRKYDLIERAHGYIRNRNQQTRYNGLMENDFDDDPLLI